ncbi:MAG TPA: hypothetical protein VLJ37_05070 [bacterium]|nr:hypothetical protein [bacterium]
MRIIATWRRIRLWLVLFFAAVSGGCPSPGGPPAPPAEIPALVAFPKSVGIDVSRVAGESPSSALVADSAGKAQSGIDNFSDLISLGPITFNSFSSLLDDFLGPLSDLEIPVSPTVTTFEGPMTFAPGLVAAVKIDFADFDLDGDGASEGCTNCTCPTGCAPAFSECPTEAPVSRLKPVCYRIWLRDVGQTEYVRFLAGRFDRYATRDDPETEGSEENAGEGRFRMGVEPPPTPDGMRNPLALGVLYDHRHDTDPLKKETEFFILDRRLDAGGAPVSSDEAHALVTQETPAVPAPEGTLRKTVKLDLRKTPDPEDGPGLVQYIGRFRDDLDFWGGTFNLQDIGGVDPKTVSGEDVCARISTGEETADANCTDAGISVTGEGFLRAAAEADSSFPAGFPESPTF